MTSASDTPIPSPDRDDRTEPADAVDAASPPPRPRRRKPAAPAAEGAVPAGVDSAVASSDPAEGAHGGKSDGDGGGEAAHPEPAGMAQARDGGDGEGGEGGEGGDGEGMSGERSRRRNRRERRRNEDRPPARLALPPNFEGPLPLHLLTPIPPEAGAVFSQVISGEFDSQAEPPPDDDPAKRILAPERDAPKLHKVLAQAGIGSRRDLEDMILEGRISVNGEPAHTGQRVSFGDRVEVDGKPVRLRIVPPPSRIIAYHKPAGEIVTHDDPENRPTVFRRLPRLQQGKWQSVGRLDINTEGLLLFTNSGGLANQLMHPRFGVEREYAVRVMGTLDDEARSRLLEGVEVDGQRAAFKSIERGGGEGLNQWYRVVITEGRNREVRKLFDVVGLTVSRLIRIRYGTIVLPHGLKRGVWVDLEENDMRSIRRLAGGAPQERGEGRPEAPGMGGGQGLGGGNGGNAGAGQGKRREDRNARPGRPADRPPGPERNRPAGPRRDEARFDAPRPAEDRPPRDPDADDDFEIDPASIPNPLQQTFDHRFVQGRRIGPNSGFGAGGSAPRPTGGEPRGGPKQPDPLQTSMGYIGADAYRNKTRGNRNGRGGGGQGGGGYGGGNSGGGGGSSGGGGGGYGGGGGGRRGR